MSQVRKLIVLIAAVALAYPAEFVFAQETPEGQTASVNGMQMYYEIHGQGDPLVMLHGFTGTGGSWKNFIDDFAAHYRLIIPDLRGHGRSTNPTGKFTHRQSALDVYALLDQLGIERFKAMGSSTGGMTLLHMATQQPERVEAMILIGATIYFPEQARVIMRQTSPETASQERWENLRKNHKHGDDQIRALLTQFNNFKDSYDDMNFTSPYLSTITAKTLIVHGDRDRFFPVSIPVEMYSAIPHSYLWIVPNGGHGPIGGKNASVFTRIALEFLQGEWEGK
jgi:pimeloyl-ACP methyl ester carboxylesterase